MNSQTKLPKISWLVLGFTVIVILAVFSIIGSRFLHAQNASGQSQKQIVNSQSTWDAAFTEWFGKKAPGLSINDIDGKNHRLSDYLGRNVLVVFWATWCPACNLEIPHLIELRKALPEDKLAILAISNEEPERLKKFAVSKGINYTVASLGGSSLPKPFADVTSIPTTFFIGPDGKIKYAALGVVSPADAKVIMNAE